MKPSLYLLLFVPVLLIAQPTVVDTDRFSFEPNLTFDNTITKPSDFLGYELGQEFTVYAHVTAYFKSLAASSERVLYNQYGETYEGRPLINLVISSEENIQDIASIQSEHLDFLKPGSDIDVAGLPVFTSFSYNIHGNEASGTEAAMQVAYRMAAATDDETLEILDNSVIVMYICINPDGRDRYVYWYKTTKRLGRAGFEPSDMEHDEGWPGGRTNHYWFDLNRDWIWQVHPESRGHSGEYLKWMPQVHVDYHEQGYNSNYFTMPGTTPRNKLLPDAYEPWSEVFGDANVEAFDKHQINYFTRDRFDFFYPSYGSSYPSVLGAIGMLTEQGGHAAGGKIVETEDGVNLTLRQRIFDHYTTSIATIKASNENRAELLSYTREALNPSNSKSKTKAYFFSGQDMFSSDLVNVLIRNDVAVYQADRAFTLNAAKDFRSGSVARKNLAKGTYIVPTSQQKSLFINSIMERNMAIEDSVMYDMATWSAPIAYNLEAFSTTSDFSVAMTEITEEIAFEGTITNKEAQYAFVIDWKERNAPQALSKLWSMGYRVRSAFEPFGRDGRSFTAGSLIVLRGRNLEKADQIEADMEKVAKEAGVDVYGFDTGRMQEGMDLANTSNRPIKQPKIALLTESPFSSYTAGQIYYLFDWETQLPIERVRLSRLKQTSLPQGRFRFGGVDLNDYNVLILAGGGGALNQIFKEDALEQVKNWVKNGGTLVATESAAKFFTKTSKFTEVTLKKLKKDTSDAAKYLTYADIEEFNGKKRIPGTALKATVDITNPLAFGVKQNLYSLKFGTDGLQPHPSLQTVGYYDKEVSQLSVAGYASEENLRHLAGTTFAGVLPMGSGKVVFLIDNTQYRMFWRGPSRMMQNAAMQLPGY